MLTIKQTAEKMNLNISYVRKLIQNKKLKVQRLGKRGKIHVIESSIYELENGIYTNVRLLDKSKHPSLR